MNRLLALIGAALFGAALAASASAQTATNGPVTAALANPDRPAESVLATDPWEFGPFLQGGYGTGNRDTFHFLSAGIRLGKVLTDPHLGSIFRGQFEYAGELMPLWQAYTPKAGIQPYPYNAGNGETSYAYLPTGGGTFTGASITPIILRWDLTPHRRIAPWLQGAGGLVYTTHKFPPDILVPHGTPGGTSVFNFTPQFGVGLHYFIKPNQSLTFAANAIHISSASLGDKNPGVNASVQFQVGYTWWR